MRTRRLRRSPRHRGRCARRFTGFISERSGRFVSHRIRLCARHTAIQKSPRNDAFRRIGATPARA
ncbi:hypothetical protein CA830_06630 [Burkholderia multivorans]|nr:hypothetical protein CA831_07015 [Burkholderia multivorans]OXH93596.1 hypothetical protein CA830_06630 [Burkholderia multivorans]